MLICNKSVPLSVKKILTDFFEHQHQFPRNDWNPDTLLKIFQLAFEHRQDISASFELWKQLRCLKGSHETKLKIYILATKLIFGKYLDNYVDNLFAGRLNFQVITDNQHLVGQILLHVGKQSPKEVDNLFRLINRIPSDFKQKVIDSLCCFASPNMKPLLERLVNVNNNDLYEIFSVIIPNQIRREDYEHLICHPVDELIEILLTAIPLMKYEKQSADQLDMIASLSLCAPVHRKRIVKDAGALLHLIRKNKCVIIRKLGELRQGLTKTAKESLLQAFKPGADGNDVGNLILALDRYPQEHQREAVCLLNESGILLGRSGFLDMLCDIPYDNRRPLCALIKSNCVIQSSSSGLSTLMLAIKNIPTQDLQHLFGQLFLYFPSLPKHKLTLIATLIGKINTIRREERSRYLQFCAEIFPKLKTYEHLSLLLDTYYGLREQDDGAELIFTCLYRLEKNIPQLINILKTLCLYDKDKRLTVIKSIESSKKEKSLIPLALLIDLYITVDPSEAEEIIDFYLRHLKEMKSIKNLNLFVKIPRSERPPFMEAISSIIKHLKYAEDVQKMLELVACHHLEAVDLCNLTAQLLGTSRHTDGEVILKTLIPIPARKRKPFIESLLPIIPLSLTSADCATLIERIYIYPEAQHEELLEILNLVLEENCEVNEIMNCIKGVPLEFINQRLTLALKLNKQYERAISSLFIKLFHIPSHRLEAVVNDVEEIHRRFPAIKDVEGLFALAATQHDEQFEKTLQKIESAKFTITLASELVSLFHCVEAIPQELIHKLLNAAEGLLKSFDAPEQGNIISLFVRYREEQWPFLLADIKFLTENCFIKRAKLDIIETYLALSTSKLNVRQNFGPFLDGYRGSRVELVKNLLSFPRRFWTDTYPLCLPLLAQCPNNPHIKVRIMTQVSQIYPKQRENIIRHVAALELSPEEFNTLFQILQNVPRIKRDQLMDDGAELLKSVRDSYVASLIGHLDALPPPHRKDLIKELTIHFHPVNDHDIGQILTRLSLIPAQKRQSLYTFLEPYFKSCHSANGRIEIMQALSDIPENRWVDALRIYSKLSTVIDSWENILSFILQLPEHKQRLSIQLAERFLHKGQLGEDQLRLLQALLKHDDDTILTKLTRIDTSVSYLSIRQRILAIEIIESVPDSVLNFILESDFWKKRHHFPHKLMEIFHSLGNYPPSQITHILEIVLPILPLLNCKREEFFLTLLDHFKKTPWDQWPFYTHCMLTLIMGQRLESHHLLYAGAALNRLGIPFLEKTLPYVKPLLERIPSLKERVDFLNELRNAKLDNLPDAYALMKEYLPFVKEHQGTLIKILTLIPAESRRLVFSQALNMIHYTDEQAPLHCTLKILKQLDAQERVDIIKFVGLLSSRMSYLYLPDLILKELCAIKPSNREKVVRFYLNYPFHPDICGHKILKMIDRLITQGDDDKLLQLAPIIQMIRDEYGLIRSIPVLLTMLAEERKDLLARAKTAAKEFHDPAPFIKIIYSLKNDNFSEILNAASPILSNIDNVTYIENVLTQLSLIAEEDREYMINLTLPLHSKMRDVASNGQAFKQILADLYSIPRSEHEEILELVNMMGRPNADYTGHLIHLLVGFEPSERAEIVKAALPFRIDLPASCCVELINAVSRYSQKERLKGLHQLLNPLFSQVDNPQSHFNLLTGLSWFRESERLELIELLPPYVYARGEGNEHQVLQSILLIAPQHRNQVVHLLNTEIVKFGPNLLHHVYNQYGDIRNASYEYLKQLLDDYFEDKSLSLVLANILLHSANSILLHEEHPLLQKAIEIMALHSTDNDRLNPYNLFRSLKQLIPHEELCPYQPLSYAIGSQHIAIPVHKWREIASPIIYRLADLPKGLLSFEKLFQNFEQRVSQLSTNKQTEVHHYISECYLDVPSKLQEDFVNKQYVRSLFQIVGPPDLIIEPAAYFIHVILKYICDQDDAVPEGKLISKREDALFRVSCSINECKTGQRDGIVSFYNYLPEEYSIGTKRESEEKLACIVKKSIQGVLHQTFSNMEFVKLLDPSATSSQYPHKALYLMNRLHRQVGYDHRLTFDANTGLVPEAFLDIPVEFMLRHFFAVCTPEMLINRFRRDIEESLRVKSICYMDLAHALERLKIKLTEGIVVDETDMPIGVSEEAALAILVDNEALEVETKKN